MSQSAVALPLQRSRNIQEGKETIESATLLERESWLLVDFPLLADYCLIELPRSNKRRSDRVAMHHRDSNYDE